jgi:hypothetical protein
MPQDGGFKEFAALFHEGLFVNLICYGDESGIHDATGLQPGSDVAVVAGCFALKHEWEAFEILWCNVLEKYRVPVFHMSDFVASEFHPKPPYSGLSKQEREDFVTDLCKVVRACPIYKVGRAVHVKEYAEVFPDKVKSFFRHPYHFCFWQLLSEFVDGNEMRLSWFPRGERVAFFFEQQDQFSDHAVQTFNRFISKLDPTHLLGSIAFVRKDYYVPLQAADLFAYRYRTRESRARREGASVVILERGSWDEILFDEKTSTHYYDADAMRGITPRLIQGIERWRD